MTGSRNEDIWDLRRPQSIVRDRTQGHRPNRKTSRPRIGGEMPRLTGSRSAPSCCELHGMGDGNFEKLRVEALFVIDLRDDYATRRNAKRMRRVDDDDGAVEGGNSMLT